MMNKPFVEKPVPYSGAYSPERAWELVEETLRKIKRGLKDQEEEQREKDKQLRLKLE